MAEENDCRKLHSFEVHHHCLLAGCWQYSFCYFYSLTQLSTWSWEVHAHTWHVLEDRSHSPLRFQPSHSLSCQCLHNKGGLLVQYSSLGDNIYWFLLLFKLIIFLKRDKMMVRSWRVVGFVMFSQCDEALWPKAIAGRKCLCAFMLPEGWESITVRFGRNNGRS